MRGIAPQKDFRCGANPSPERVCRTALAALSHKGRGRINRRRRLLKERREETRKMSARYEELKGLKNIGQKVKVVWKPTDGAPLPFFTPA